MKKNKLELAWAAGFFDGEGSSKPIWYHYKTKKGEKKNPTRNVCLTVCQSNLEPLERFKKAVNDIGRINGPYQYKPNKRPYWVYSTSCASAREVFKLLKPYLSSIKVKQFETVSDLVLKDRADKKYKGWIHDEA